MADQRSTYRLSSTSLASASVEDVSLTQPDEGRLTRRILRATIVENEKDADATVHACLLHQRRANRKAAWEDVDSFRLSQLRGGEEAKLDLHASETKRLYEELSRLYAVGDGGVPLGTRKFVVFDLPGGRVPSRDSLEIISELLGDRPDEFWRTLDELDPEALRNAAINKVHEMRSDAVETFRRELEADDWDEPHWQRFFEENTWIFGLGLSYHFLPMIQARPAVGGTDASRTGGQESDAMLATGGDLRFTVLVEIKRPDTSLIGGRYRNHVYELGDDLVGGVAQVQGECHRWSVEGSQHTQNRDWLESQRIYAVQPKGILVVGKTGDLGDDRDKWSTFELFRRNTLNPDILTYDELLARAEFAVSNSESLVMPAHR